ncbi:OprD family outer membrane porin [Paraburkholderia tropica]|uniref:OprD family outer membrane porin n=1 Tax=Paraburkholderia tropica TaxID=92647 RepID=UPI002AB693FD|nr:OprD family outer membrane porin [Paraburkholderia tropica]
MLQRALATTALLTVAPAVFADGFFQDSSVVLDTRVLAYNRDWRSGTGQSFGRETASLTQLKFVSGFTPGLIGLGFDFDAMSAIKLDSSPSHSGVLLRTQKNGEANEFSGKVMPMLKARVSKTVLNIGDMVSYLPVLNYDGAVLPQVYHGARITSNQIDGLTINAGRFSEVMNRSAVGYVPIQISTSNNSYKTLGRGEDFDYAGVEYTYRPLDVTGTYYFARFENVYDQHYFNAVQNWALNSGKITGDLRAFDSKNQGSALTGKVDNFLYSALLRYQTQTQLWSASYQRSTGPTAFPFISGTDPYLTNYQLIGTFAQAGESSWKVQYEFNLRRFGLPGLSISNMYIKGTGIKETGYTGNEWERDLDVTYTFDRNGPFKGLRLKWRNGTYRTNFTRNIDENRLFIFYTIALK